MWRSVFIHCVSYYSLLIHTVHQEVSKYSLCPTRWSSVSRFWGYWNYWICYKVSWITYSWDLSLRWTNVNPDIFADVSMLQIFSSKRTKPTSTNLSQRRECYITFWRSWNQIQFSYTKLHHYTLWAFKICILFKTTSSSLMLYAIWNMQLKTYIGISI